MGLGDCTVVRLCVVYPHLHLFCAINVGLLDSGGAVLPYRDLAWGLLMVQIIAYQDAIKKLNEMLQGLQYVREDKDIHKDAKDLARPVAIDIRHVIMLLQAAQRKK